MDLRRGINLAVEHVLADLKKRAKMISTTEEIAQVLIPTIVLHLLIPHRIVASIHSCPPLLLELCLLHASFPWTACRFCKLHADPVLHDLVTIPATVTVTVTGPSLHCAIMLWLLPGRHNLCQWRERDWGSDSPSYGARGQGRCHHCRGMHSSPAPQGHQCALCMSRLLCLATVGCDCRLRHGICFRLHLIAVCPATLISGASGLSIVSSCLCARSRCTV